MWIIGVDYHPPCKPSQSRNDEGVNFAHGGEQTRANITDVLLTSFVPSRTCRYRGLRFIDSCAPHGGNFNTILER